MTISLNSGYEDRETAVVKIFLKHMKTAKIKVMQRIHVPSCPSKDYVLPGAAEQYKLLFNTYISVKAAGFFAC